MSSRPPSSDSSPFLIPLIAAGAALLLLLVAFTLLRKNKNDYETPVDPDVPPMEVIHEDDKEPDLDGDDGGLRGY